MTALLGWLGMALLALCAVPLAVDAYRGRLRGVSALFLWLWWLGEVAMLAHVVLSRGSQALFANYAANVAMVGFVLFRKVAQ